MQRRKVCQPWERNACRQLDAAEPDSGDAIRERLGLSALCALERPFRYKRAQEIDTHAGARLRELSG